MDRTLILVKPDAFARNLTGEIIARFERKGLRLAALKLDDHQPRAGAGALRRARRAPVLRRARRLHHQRPAGRDGARGPRGRRRRPPGDRRDEPARGRHRLDPRRLRARGRLEHGARLGLERVGRARGRPVLPRARPDRRRARGCSGAARPMQPFAWTAARPPDPRLGEPAADGDPHAARRRARGAGDGRAGAGAGRAVRARGRERAAQGGGRRRGARARRGRGRRRPRLRHRRRPRRPGLRQAGRRARRRGRSSATCRAARTTSSARWRSPRPAARSWSAPTARS